MNNSFPIRVPFGLRPSLKSLTSRVRGVQKVKDRKISFMLQQHEGKDSHVLVHYMSTTKIFGDKTKVGSATNEEI